MQTHLDSDANDFRRDFMDRLEARAADDFLSGRSKITGGTKDEEIICAWNARGVYVRQLPDDEQGILRISIGGGKETPVPLNYLVFRGKHSQCVDLLRKALIALQEGPGA